MQIFDNIIKTYNERIRSGMTSEQARIFADEPFTNIERDLLENLQSQGLIELWVHNGFSLTDYGIDHISN